MLTGDIYPKGVKMFSTILVPCAVCRYTQIIRFLVECKVREFQKTKISALFQSCLGNVWQPHHFTRMRDLTLSRGYPKLHPNVVGRVLRSIHSLPIPKTIILLVHLKQTVVHPGGYKPLTSTPPISMRPRLRIERYEHKRRFPHCV